MQAYCADDTPGHQITNRKFIEPNKPIIVHQNRPIISNFAGLEKSLGMYALAISTNENRHSPKTAQDQHCHNTDHGPDSRGQRQSKVDRGLDREMEWDRERKAEKERERERERERE